MVRAQIYGSDLGWLHSIGIYRSSTIRRACRAMFSQCTRLQNRIEQAEHTLPLLYCPAVLVSIQMLLLQWDEGLSDLPTAPASTLVCTLPALLAKQLSPKYGVSCVSRLQVL